MRLPQSCNHLFSSFCAVSITVLVIFAALPLHASTRWRQQLSSSPSNLRFGAVAVAQSETQTAVLTNGGQNSVTISAVTASGAGFSVSGLTQPAVLGAGQSVNLSVTFSPSKMGWVSGTVTITSNASNPTLQLGLRGDGTSGNLLSATPSSLSFGQVAEGSNSSLSVVLTNVGSGSETLSAFQTVGSSFSVSGPATPLTLSKGQSISLSVTFAPQASGTLTGSVFVSGPGLNIPLTGTGTTPTVGQLTVSPSTLNFGNVDINAPTTQSSTISASRGSVTITSASSSSSLFSVSGVSLPLTLNAGQSAQLNIIFDPTSAGTDSATLTLVSNASNSTATESLTGTAISPTYSVTLTWNVSTSSVSGYNVYRGTTVGSYTKINTTLDPSTSYTDGTVVSGTTYYYAATAVNSSGQESSYSTPVQVSIP